MNNLKPYLVLPAFMASLMLNAQVATVSSPDGKLTVAVDIKGGQPVYQVQYDGKQMRGESPVGFVADKGDHSEDTTYVTQGTAHLE